MRGFQENIYTIRTLRSYEGDGNENVQKAIGLVSKTTTLHVHNDFLYISLSSLHDYDGKMPNFTLMDDVNKQRRTLSLPELG